MWSEGQVERFAGERILAIDPRTERTSRPCPACGLTQHRTLGIKNRLEIVGCEGCGTLYTPYSPWYTSTYYYTDYHNHGGLSTSEYVRTRLAEITKEFSKYRQTNRLLDVGCGAGGLLEAARDQGWKAQGVDVSETAVKHVRSLGFNAFHGELQDAKLSDQDFDVITAGELLEHVFDPAAVLKEMARLLRPGGLLWTTTPHCRGLSGRILGLKWSTVSPPEHLQLFSVSGLRTVLNQAGFREVTLKTEGANPFEIVKMRQSSNGAQETPKGNERAELNCRLNTTFAETRMRRALKNAVNQILRLSHLGDSLKVFAVK